MIIFKIIPIMPHISKHVVIMAVLYSMVGNSLANFLKCTSATSV
jgi:hypothetical protein